MEIKSRLSRTSLGRVLKLVNNDFWLAWLVTPTYLTNRVGKPGADYQLALF